MGSMSGIVAGGFRWGAIGSRGLRDEVPPPLLSRERPLERWLRDGTPVRLRLIDDRDRERLRAGFRALSPESRYRRFFTPVPRLTEDMLDRLVRTDGWDHVAVGAERGGLALGRRDGLGVARFIRLADRPDTAEIAVAVIDAMQRLGLGRLLLQALSRAARDRGVRRFRALVLPGNQEMQHLLRHLDPDLRVAMEDGLCAFELDVPDVELDEVGLSSSQSLLGFARDVLDAAMTQASPLALWRNRARG
jgi:GNAT superfamily N-acetyltransferase